MTPAPDDTTLTGTAPVGEGRTTTWLRHGKARLALHTLRPAAPDGSVGVRPLLWLHGLGEHAPEAVPSTVTAWPGPVLGLDLTGHGESDLAPGGGYTAETLMADVDAALAATGPATVIGRGLGAYLALLIAGGRPELVRGAVLTDGPGLVGGGIRPGSPSIPRLRLDGAVTPDPFALLEMSRDVRPPDYAVEYVRLANEWSGLDHPLAVCTVVRPEWLAAVQDQPGVLETTVPEALVRYVGPA